jgi:hypothetical protein
VLTQLLLGRRDNRTHRLQAGLGKQYVVPPEPTPFEVGIELESRSLDSRLDVMKRQPGLITQVQGPVDLATPFDDDKFRLVVQPIDIQVVLLTFDLQRHRIELLATPRNLRTPFREVWVASRTRASSMGATGSTTRSR